MMNRTVMTAFRRTTLPKRQYALMHEHTLFTGDFSMKQIRLLKIFVCMALCWGILFAPAHHASAATIPVTTCNASDLIGAISTANSNGAADTITLTAGCTYAFTTANNWWFGPNALPAIASDITIDGNGAILEVSAGVTRLRFFYVGADPAKFSSPMTTAGTSGALTLRNLTLRGGIAKGEQQRIWRRRRGGQAGRSSTRDRHARPRHAHGQQCAGGSTLRIFVMGGRRRG